MTDERLRELERGFKETGSVEDEAAWLRARVKAGELEQHKLELAAYCGHEAASVVLPGAESPQVSDLASLLGGLMDLKGFGAEALARSLVAVHGAVNPTGGLGPEDWDEEDEAAVQYHTGVTQGLEAHALGPSAESERALSEFLEERGGNGGPTGVLLALARQAVRDNEHPTEPEILWGLLRDQLVPWALGYRDSVRERVEARQQEAAGE